MYAIEPSFSIYNEEKFLDHTLKRESEAKNVKLVGDRVASYGILNFGAMSAGSAKKIVLADWDIKSPISLRSIYAFTNNAGTDETRFYLYSGNIELVELKLTNSEMPYIFPPGAIVTPDLTIWVKPKGHVTSLIIYWQPVHVISNIEV